MAKRHCRPSLHYRYEHYDPRRCGLNSRRRCYWLDNWSSAGGARKILALPETLNIFPHG